MVLNKSLVVQLRGMRDLVGLKIFQVEEQPPEWAFIGVSAIEEHCTRMKAQESNQSTAKEAHLPIYS